MRALRWAGAVIVVIAVALQLVPYGRRHTNPSGYDCHSNETVWPWYSHVAPMSWLLQRDVDEGRRKLNFSEWGRPRKEARESAKAVQKGEMPPWYYIPLHPDARLTAAETRALVTGLQATLGAKGAKGRDD
jgi:heme-binding protein